MWSSTLCLFSWAVETVITSFVPYLRRKRIISSRHMNKPKMSPIHADGLRIPTQSVQFCNGSCCPVTILYSIHTYVISNFRHVYKRYKQMINKNLSTRWLKIKRHSLMVPNKNI